MRTIKMPVCQVRSHYKVIEVVEDEQFCMNCKYKDNCSSYGRVAVVETSLKYVNTYYGIWTGFLGNMSDICLVNDDLGNCNKYFTYDWNERRGAFRMLPIIKLFDATGKEDIPVSKIDVGVPVKIKHLRGKDRNGRIRDYLYIKKIKWVHPKIRENPQLIFILSRYTDGKGRYEREVLKSPVRTLVDFSNCHFHGLCATDIEHYPLQLRYEYCSHSGATKEEYDFNLPSSERAFFTLFGRYFSEEEKQEISENWKNDCRNSFLLGIWDRNPNRYRLKIQKQLLIRWLNSHPDEFTKRLKEQYNYQFDVREATQL